MSRPAQNARPSPRSTSARTPAASASTQAASSSASALSSRAFSFDGASSTIVATSSAMVRSIMGAPRSDVVVDDHAVAGGVGLAGEHEAALELVGLQGVVLGHR